MRTRMTGMALGFLVAFAAGPALAQDEDRWGYDKGFFFRTSKFELKISTRTQFRYTYNMTDESSTTDDHGFFNLPRTRLRLDGFAYYPWLKYKVQYDFTGSEDVGDKTLKRPDLRDLYFDLARNARATVRLGQFKAPLGIQEMTSSGDQEFVDRSIVSKPFAPSRQQGAMLWGTSFGKKFGYEAGAFNGNMRNRDINDNLGYMYVARVHFDPAGEYRLSESSLDHPEKINWTIGAAWMLTTIEPSLLKTAEELQQRTGEGFFALKYRGLFVLADYYARTEEAGGGVPDVDSDGLIGQIGFFLVPRKTEVALRYGYYDKNKDARDNKQIEKRIGFGQYFRKHDLKFQADYGQEETESPVTDTKTDVFRAQFQIVF